MTSRQDDVALGDAPDDALAARLDAEIAAFNFDVTEIRDARAFAAALHDDDGELIAGVQGWTWGATCGVERLWVREDARHRGVGRRLMAAVEAEARTRVCGQLALTTHRSSTPSRSASRSAAPSRIDSSALRCVACASASSAGE